jgi:hypothetical protein
VSAIVEEAHLMSESDLASLWLTRILDWPQAIDQLLGPFPLWALLSLIFLPSLIALATRIWHQILPVLMLNALIALSTISWPAGELRIFSTAVATALILAFLGKGLRRRSSNHALAELQTRLDAIEEQITQRLSWESFRQSVTTQARREGPERVGPTLAGS